MQKAKRSVDLVTERLELSTLASHNEELLAPRANQLCHATEEVDIYHVVLLYKGFSTLSSRSLSRHPTLRTTVVWSKTKKNSPNPICERSEIGHIAPCTVRDTSKFPFHEHCCLDDHKQVKLLTFKDYRCEKDSLYSTRLTIKQHIRHVMIGTNSLSNDLYIYLQR